MQQANRLLILIFTLTSWLTLGQYLIDSSPTSYKTSGLYGWDHSYISASCTTHVTTLTHREYFFVTGGIYGLKVNGLGVRVPDQWGGNDEQTITFTALQRVTSIKVWRGSSCCEWFFEKMEFILNDGTSKMFQRDTPGNNIMTFTIPTGMEFVGFGGRSGATGWTEMKVWISCATPANTGITFDLTNIEGKYQEVTAGTTVSLAFTITDVTAGACGPLVYSVSVSPAFVTGGLISVPNVNTAEVRFLASTNAADVNKYTVTVSAYYSGSISVCPATASATYNYIAAGCSTSTITPNPYDSITAQLSPGTTGNYNFNQWRDSVSVVQGGLKCGTITYKTNIISSPGTYNHLTMGGMFSYSTVSTTNPPTSTITITPTVVDQIGVYSITTTACLDMFPTICGTSSARTITVIPCQVTSIAVVQDSDGLAIINQAYSVPSTTAFSYQLKAVETPACGYTTTAWAATTTSTDNAPNTGSYNSVTATGLFSAGPYSDSVTFGNYYLSIASVTLSVVGVDIAITSIATSPTKQFLLTVSDGCADAIVTSSTPTAFSLKVFDPVQAYGSFAAFTYTSTAGSTLCGVVEYTAIIALGTSANSISTFTLDTELRNFQVQSGDMNQIGTYSVTLNGCLPIPHASKCSARTFSFEVIDPCLSTTLTWASTMSVLSTSVKVLDTDGSNLIVQQTAPEVTDAVSTSQSIAGLCQGFTYTVSDVPDTGVTQLTASELSIDQITRTLSIWTDISLTVGRHTVTVTAKLTAYTSITISISFILTIQPCIVTSFIMQPLSNQVLTGVITSYDYQYKISYPEHTFTIPNTLTTQVPSCAYIVSISSNKKPDYVSTSYAGSDLVFKSYTRDVIYAGVHQVSVDAILSNYPYAVSPTTTQFFTSTAIDPCYSSTFVTKPANVESLSVFAGYQTKSKFSYLFNDTSSETQTLTTDKFDFCGPKKFKFTLNSSQTTYLSGYNGGSIVLNTDSKDLKLGESQAQLFGYLQEYITVVSQPINFVVTVLESVPPVIKSQTYSIGNRPLQIQFDAFQVLPEGFAVTLTGSISLYLVADGFKLPKRLSSSQQGLTSTTDLGWITLDQEKLQIVVETSNENHQGSYQLVLICSYDQHPKVRPYTQLKLQVSPKFVYVNANYWIGAPNPRIPLFSSLGIELADSFSADLTLSQLTGVPVDRMSVVNNLTPVAYLEIVVNDVNRAGTNSTFQLTARSALVDSIEYPTLILNLKFYLPPEKMEEYDMGSDVNRTKKQNFTIVPAAPKVLLRSFGRLLSVAPFLDSTKNQIFLAEEFAKIVNVTFDQPQLKDPDAFLGVITATGQFQVLFNHQMYNFPSQLVQNATEFNKTLEIYQPILMITIVPGKFSDPQYLNFTYNITEFTPKSLSIQLAFDHPSFVSAQAAPDILMVEFVGNFYFFDSKGRIIPEWKTITRTIPRQLEKNDTFSEFLNSNKQKVQYVTQSLVYGGWVLNFFLRAALSQILGMINTQQLIVLMPLFDMALPANAALFFEILTSLASFDIYDTDGFYNKVFPQMQKADLGPLNDNFDALGYNATFILNNLGTLIFSIILIPVLLAITTVFKLLGYYFKSAKWIYSYLSSKLFWAYFLGLLYESYSAVILSVLINFKHVSFSIYLHYVQVTFDSFGEVINSAVLFGFAFVCLAAPLVFGALMLIYFKRLRDKSVSKRFGLLYEELNLDNGRTVVAIPVTFLLRRLFMSVAVVFTSNFLLQIYTTFAFSVIQFASLGEAPYLLASQTSNEFFNETFIMLVLYSFFCFTDFVTDLRVRYQAGFFVGFIVTMHLVVNLLWIFIISIKSPILRIKHFFARLKQRRRKNETVVPNAKTEQSQLGDLSATNQLRRPNLLEAAVENLESRKNTHQQTELLKQKKPNQGYDFESLLEQSDESILNSPQNGKIQLLDPDAIEQNRIQRSFLIWDGFGSEELMVENQVKESIDAKRRQIFASHGILSNQGVSIKQAQLDEIKEAQDELRYKLRNAGLLEPRAATKQIDQSADEIDQMFGHNR